MSAERARLRLAALASHIGAPDPRADQVVVSRYVPDLAQLATVHVAGESKAAQPCPRQRTVVVAGARTPFIKSFTELRKNDSINLGMAAVGGLLARTKIDPALVDQLVFGNVVLNSAAPNLAREIIIDLNLPRTISGTTVSVACLSGLDAINTGSLAIEHGQAKVVIAGGSDSLSNGELGMPRRFTQAVAMYQMGGGNKKGWQGLKQMLSEAGPVSSWAPKPNSISERSTGKTMGYHADVMAELNQIQRKDQDAFALSSHQKAAKAQQSGVLGQEIVPIKSELTGKMVSQDNIIRGSINAQKVAELPPVFRPNGTVTAASSSPLTDGASAVLLMSDAKAKELGLPADVFIRAYAKTAIDPNPQLLLAPAVAIHLALKAAGLQLSDIDYFEIHEAFAAQVLSTLKVLQDKDWARKALKLEGPVGTIPLDKVNPYGGSIAIGHPFAATGGRLVTSVVNELRRSNKRLALISICAAGGIGGVMILERVPQ